MGKSERDQRWEKELIGQVLTHCSNTGRRETLYFNEEGVVGRSVCEQRSVWECSELETREDGTTLRLL